MQFKNILNFSYGFSIFLMISTALQTLKETLQVPPTLWPASPQFSNFAEVFKTIPVDIYLKNSLIACTSVVLFQF